MVSFNEYARIHQGLRRNRGKASDYPCSAPDCTHPARNWAWQRTGPSSSGRTGKGVAVTWGTDPSTYAPMCVPHAAQLDHGGTLTHCRNGHPRSPGNTYKNPTGGVRCLTCKKEARAARNALKVRATCPHCGVMVHEAGISRHIRRMHAT